jgi:hypothetical protein
MTRRISGSGLAPTDLTSIVASCFLDCDVLIFKLKASALFDLVDDNANAMPWEEIVRVLKAKCRSLLGKELWTPVKSVRTPESTTLDGLHAAINVINRLSAQVGAGAPKPAAVGPCCSKMVA